MFSPQSNVIAFTNGNSVFVGDIQTGRILHKFEGHEHWVKSVAFCPDGTLLVSTANDNTIRIWDLNLDKILRIIPSNLSANSSACFSQDGKYILATELESIGIWDLKTGVKIYTMDEQHMSISAISAGAGSALFSPNGNDIISIAMDRDLRQTPFPPLQQLIDETRERFKNRQLTTEERRKYYLE